MWKLIGFLAILLIHCQNALGQTTTTTTPMTTTSTTTTTTTMTPMVSQNVSVNPKQIINFKIPGAKLLSLLSIFALIKSKFSGGGGEGFVGRCFGAARKLKFIMPFLLYKLGVIVTTLGFLTLFTLKGLLIGVILLVLNAGGWLGKLAFLKGGYYGGGGGGGGGWSGGHHHHGWHGKSHGQAPVPVHIHVHKDRNDEGVEYVQEAPYHGPYDGHGYGSRGDGVYVGHSGGEYDPGAPVSWAERISKGLNGTSSLAERIELINLYKRLGFNVNEMIGREQDASAGSGVYPRRVVPFPDNNPIR